MALKRRRRNSGQVASVEVFEDRTLLSGFNSVDPAGSLIYSSAETGAAGTDVPVFGDGLDSAPLGGEWSTSSSNALGRIQVNGAFGTAAGAGALLMDVTVNGNNNLNEAVLTVDLSGVSNAELSFFHADFNDEELSLPLDFAGSVNGDGVSVSDDGVNWRTVLNATNLAFGVWTPVTVDLAAAATAAGMSLGSNFQIKFQQFDNFALTTDGRGYDEVAITTAVPDDPDTFTIDVAGPVTLV